MTESHTKPVFYRRWNYSHTVKGGWQPKDITISITYEDGKDPGHAAMVEEARKAMAEAQEACDELNAREAEIARFTGVQAR